MEILGMVLILLIIISLLITIFNIVLSIPILKYELKENKEMGYGYDTRETIPHYMLFIVLSFIPIYNVTLLIETFNDYINIRNGSN